MERHKILILVCVGSNPTAPANNMHHSSVGRAIAVKRFAPGSSPERSTNYCRLEVKENVKMRDERRIEPIVNDFLALWKKYPDLRFGQMVSLVYAKSTNEYSVDPFYLEDDEWSKVLKLLKDGF